MASDGAGTGIKDSGSNSGGEEVKASQGSSSIGTYLKEGGAGTFESAGGNTNTGAGPGNCEPQEAEGRENVKMLCDWRRRSGDWFRDPEGWVGLGLERDGWTIC